MALLSPPQALSVNLWCWGLNRMKVRECVYSYTTAGLTQLRWQYAHIQ